MTVEEITNHIYDQATENGWEVDLNRGILVARGLKHNLEKHGELYCPCTLEKSPDAVCPCKEFRECKFESECHCGLYRK